MKYSVSFMQSSQEVILSNELISHIYCLFYNKHNWMGIVTNNMYKFTDRKELREREKREIKCNMFIYVHTLTNHYNSTR